jgi:hypothetical protein
MGRGAAVELRIRGRRTLAAEGPSADAIRGLIQEAIEETAEEGES